MNNEEKSLLKRLMVGSFDGQVGRDLTTSRGSSIWTAIKNGVPAMFKQGPDRKYFDGKENIRVGGVLHTMHTWKTDEEKLGFLQKFGWLMSDDAVKAYSAKFKPKK